MPSRRRRHSHSAVATATKIPTGPIGLRFAIRCAYPPQIDRPPKTAQFVTEQSPVSHHRLAGLLVVDNLRLNGIVKSMSPIGRPEIGQPINIRLGDELLALVDDYAASNGRTRADAIRFLLTAALLERHGSEPSGLTR